MSLSKGNVQISLRDEFAHLNAYINIQNQRFEDHIHFKHHLSSDIADFIVPKIILQHLVENAITHGILEKDEPLGTLIVSGRAAGDTIILTVEDDGVGIDKERLSHLFDAKAHSQSDSHYGLYNIKERLRLYYNDQASIQIASVVSGGTTVTIQLPVSKG